MARKMEVCASPMPYPRNVSHSRRNFQNSWKKSGQNSDKQIINPDKGLSEPSRICSNQKSMALQTASLQGFFAFPKATSLPRFEFHRDASSHSVIFKPWQGCRFCTEILYIHSLDNIATTLSFQIRKAKPENCATPSGRSIEYTYLYSHTSSTAKGGGGSFKNRKRIGDWLL